MKHNGLVDDAIELNIIKAKEQLVALRPALSSKVSHTINRFRYLIGSVKQVLDEKEGATWVQNPNKKSIRHVT